MKVIITISLSLLILTQPLSKMLLVMKYQVNKSYIAAVLCENKARPQLHCEGKCRLSKELKAASRHEEKLPQPVNEQQEFLYFHQVPTPTAFICFFVPIQNNYCAYKTVAYPSPVFGIFHPPQV